MPVCNSMMLEKKPNTFDVLFAIYYSIRGPLQTGAELTLDFFVFID